MANWLFLLFIFLLNNLNQKENKAIMWQIDT
jgi:hypothetical protein